MPAVAGLVAARSGCRPARPFGSAVTGLLAAARIVWFFLTTPGELATVVAVVLVAVPVGIIVGGIAEILTRTTAGPIE